MGPRVVSPLNMPKLNNFEKRKVKKENLDRKNPYGSRLNEIKNPNFPPNQINHRRFIPSFHFIVLQGTNRFRFLFDAICQFSGLRNRVFKAKFFFFFFFVEFSDSLLKFLLFFLVGFVEDD